MPTRRGDPPRDHVDPKMVNRYDYRMSGAGANASSDNMNSSDHSSTYNVQQSYYGDSPYYGLGPGNGTNVNYQEFSTQHGNNFAYGPTAFTHNTASSQHAPQPSLSGFGVLPWAQGAPANHVPLPYSVFEHEVPDDYTANQHMTFAQNGGYIYDAPPDVLQHLMEDSPPSTPVLHSNAQDSHPLSGLGDDGGYDSFLGIGLPDTIAPDANSPDGQQVASGNEFQGKGVTQNAKAILPPVETTDTLRPPDENADTNLPHADETGAPLAENTNTFLPSAQNAGTPKIPVKKSNTDASDSTNKRKRRQGAAKQPQQSGLQRFPPASLPPAPDLDSASACREYLAYTDPDEIELMTIEGDDVDVVKAAIDHFANEVYQALLSPFAPNPPDGVNLNEDRKASYRRKQVTAMKNVQKLLITPIQLKKAKARCILAVDAALAVHERGVPKELYDTAESYIEKGKEPPKGSPLDMTSICSARIAKMVQVVKDNKYVAMDVLKGNNLDLLAQDAGAYLKGKFSFLKSNDTRGATRGSQSSSSSNPTTPSRGTKKRMAKKRKLAEVPEVEDETKESRTLSSTRSRKSKSLPILSSARMRTVASNSSYRETRMDFND